MHSAAGILFNFHLSNGTNPELALIGSKKLIGSNPELEYRYFRNTELVFSDFF